MSYHFEQDETVPQGVRRIVVEQIDEALASLEAPERREAAVHEVRKRLKKLRAVVRLVRDEVGADVYHAENDTYRDAGRGLADVRDAHVRIATLDALAGRYDGRLAPDAFDGVRAHLVARQQEVSRAFAARSPLDDVDAALREARRRVADWPLDHDGFEALARGLARVYERGRKAMAAAYEQGTDEAFHEWRKRVKYLWYHLRLLRSAWHPVLGGWTKVLSALGDTLGEAHDLAVLRAYLEAHEAVGDAQERVLLLALIAQRGAALQAAARAPGARLYVEKPSAFTQRMAAYWQAWHQEEPSARVVVLS